MRKNLKLDPSRMINMKMVAFLHDEGEAEKIVEFLRDNGIPAVEISAVSHPGTVRRGPPTPSFRLMVPEKDFFSAQALLTDKFSHLLPTKKEIALIAFVSSAWLPLCLVLFITVAVLVLYRLYFFVG